MTTGTPEGHDGLEDLSVDKEEEHSQMQPGDTLDDRGIADVLDEGIVPPQKWSAGQGYGNTAAEQRTGETLAQRISQEEPDTDPYAEVPENLEDDQVGGPRAGRLVAPDEGAHEDEESDAVAYDVGMSGGAATAEEAAMHIVEEDEDR